MAASQCIFQGHFVDGSGPYSVKGYFASSGAAGTYVPLRPFADAAATDSVDLRVPKDVIIDDIQSVATSGMIRFESDGAPTYALIDVASRLNTNAGRVTNLGIPLGAGHLYRIRIENALSA